MKNSRGQQLLDTFEALGVEMKKLEPLEADHTKLKANFVGCKITRGWLQNGDL